MSQVINYVLFIRGKVLLNYKYLYLRRMLDFLHVVSMLEL